MIFFDEKRVKKRVFIEKPVLIVSGGGNLENLIRTVSLSSVGQSRFWAKNNALISLTIKMAKTTNTPPYAIHDQKNEKNPGKTRFSAVFQKRPFFDPPRKGVKKRQKKQRIKINFIKFFFYNFINFFINFL